MPALTVFVFGFTCHQNIIPLANELQGVTQARIDAVSAASIGAACVVYFAVAVAGCALARVLIF